MFCERPIYETGRVIEWRDGRTGNVLLKRELLVEDRQPVNPKFGSGTEDLDFLIKMIDEEHRFVWSNKAVGYEHIRRLSINWKFSKI